MFFEKQKSDGIHVETKKSKSAQNVKDIFGWLNMSGGGNRQDTSEPKSFWKFLSSSSQSIDMFINDQEDMEEINQILKVLISVSTKERAGISIVAHKAMMDSFINMLLGTTAKSMKLIVFIILANLANIQQNMQNMAEHPQLLQTVIDVGFYNDCCKIREQSVKVIQSMACCSKNQHSMVHVDYQILDRLLELMYDPVEQIRKRAVASIQNLAFSKQNRILMIQFKDGSLLNALLRLAMNDEYEQVRLQAAKALENIIDLETFTAARFYEKLFANLVYISLNDSSSYVRKKITAILSRIIYVQGKKSKRKNQSCEAGFSYQNDENTEKLIRQEINQPILDREEKVKSDGNYELCEKAKLENFDSDFMENFDSDFMEINMENNKDIHVYDHTKEVINSGCNLNRFVTKEEGKIGGKGSKRQISMSELSSEESGIEVNQMKKCVDECSLHRINKVMNIEEKKLEEIKVTENFQSSSSVKHHMFQQIDKKRKAQNIELPNCNEVVYEVHEKNSEVSKRDEAESGHSFFLFVQKQQIDEEEKNIGHCSFPSDEEDELSVLSAVLDEKKKMQREQDDEIDLHEEESRNRPFFFFSPVQHFNKKVTDIFSSSQRGITKQNQISEYNNDCKTKLLMSEGSVEILPAHSNPKYCALLLNNGQEKNKESTSKQEVNNQSCFYRGKSPDYVSMKKIKSCVYMFEDSVVNNGNSCNSEYQYCNVDDCNSMKEDIIKNLYDVEISSEESSFENKNICIDREKSTEQSGNKDFNNLANKTSDYADVEKRRMDGLDILFSCSHSNEAADSVHSYKKLLESSDGKSLIKDVPNFQKIHGHKEPRKSPEHSDDTLVSSQRESLGEKRRKEAENISNVKCKNIDKDIEATTLHHDTATIQRESKSLTPSAPINMLCKRNSMNENEENSNIGTLSVNSFEKLFDKFMTEKEVGLNLDSSNERIKNCDESKNIMEENAEDDFSDVNSLSEHLYLSFSSICNEYKMNQNSFLVMDTDKDYRDDVTSLERVEELSERDFSPDLNERTISLNALNQNQRVCNFQASHALVSSEPCQNVICMQSRDSVTPSAIDMSTNSCFNEDEIHCNYIISNGTKEYSASAMVSSHDSGEKNEDILSIKPINNKMRMNSFGISLQKSTEDLSIKEEESTDIDHDVWSNRYRSSEHEMVQTLKHKLETAKWSAKNELEKNYEKIIIKNNKMQQHLQESLKKAEKDLCDSFKSSFQEIHYTEQKEIHELQKKLDSMRVVAQADLRYSYEKITSIV